MRCTVMEQITREISSTATAVIKKSWKVFSRKSSTEVASAATKRKPVGMPEEMSSPETRSCTRGERTSLVR